MLLVFLPILAILKCQSIVCREVHLSASHKHKIAKGLYIVFHTITPINNGLTEHKTYLKFYNYQNG